MFKNNEDGPVRGSEQSGRIPEVINSGQRSLLTSQERVGRYQINYHVTIFI